MQKITRIVIADDHPVFIDGIKSLLKEVDFVEIVGQAVTGEKLVEQVSLLKPDVVLTDIQMPVKDGFEATKEIKKLLPATKVIALTMLSESSSIKKMLAAGVDAYVLKTANKEELVMAIEKVCAGEKYFNAEVTSQLMNNFNARSAHVNPLETLTKREKEILTMIAQGLTDKEIAEKVHLSPLTIITHRKNLLSKLGLKNKVELTRFAMDHNLLS